MSLFLGLVASQLPVANPHNPQLQRIYPFELISVHKTDILAAISRFKCTSDYKHWVHIYFPFKVNGVILNHCNLIKMSTERKKILTLRLFHIWLLQSELPTLSGCTWHNLMKWDAQLVLSASNKQPTYWLSSSLFLLSLWRSDYDDFQKNNSLICFLSGLLVGFL